MLPLHLLRTLFKHMNAKGIPAANSPYVSFTSVVYSIHDGCFPVTIGRDYRVWMTSINQHWTRSDSKNLSQKKRQHGIQNSLKTTNANTNHWENNRHGSHTPRIDYSQGNKWWTRLESMDDFHKPTLDAIGFQELITIRSGSMEYRTH